MADREKVMKGLECCTHGVNKCAICPYDPRYYKFDEINARSCMTQLAMDALELLEEQEPVEPAIGGNQKSCWYYICPICQLAIDKGDEYCRHCGRAVKWDE